VEYIIYNLTSCLVDIRSENGCLLARSLGITMLIHLVFAKDRVGVAGFLRGEGFESGKVF
jgi:hypothetical protein